MGELHMEYVKEGCNTPVKKNNKMLQLLNFHSVSTKFSMNIEHIILTNRVFFVFGIATFWRVNYVTNVAPKNENKLLVLLLNPFVEQTKGTLIN